MAHVKTQIRDAVVAACTGLATTGSNVFKARPDERPLQDSELPCLCIYTDRESVELGTLGTQPRALWDSQSGNVDSFGTVDELGGSGRRLMRTVEVRVRGYAKSSGDIDATLDTISAEVEAVLARDVTLGGLCKDLWPITQDKDVEGEGEKPTAYVEMIFMCEYSTSQHDATAALA